MAPYVIALLVWLALAAPAAATVKGVEPNNWDYPATAWGPDLARTHAQVARVELQWDDPLRELDAELAAVPAGVAPLLLIGGTVGPDPGAYAVRAAELYARYPGNAGVEVWNEPNTARFWGRPPSADEYAALMRATIGALPPGARVVMGGPAATVDHAGWTSAVLAQSSPDAVAVHPYAPDPAWAEQRVRDVRNVTNLPVLVTEFGWGTDCTDALCVDPATQAAYLTESLDRFQALGVDTAIWYELRDGGCLRFDCRAGLLRGDGSARPALAAFNDWAPGAPLPPPAAPPAPTSTESVVPRVTMRLRLTGRRLRMRGHAEGCAVVRVRLRRGQNRRIVSIVAASGQYSRRVRVFPGRYAARARCAAAHSRRQTFRVGV